MQIARNHLLPRVIEDHGLNLRLMDLSCSALNGVIENYTKEAGVRVLQKELAGVARWVARQVTSKDGQDHYAIDGEQLETILGPKLTSQK